MKRLRNMLFARRRLKAPWRVAWSTSRIIDYRAVPTDADLAWLAEVAADFEYGGGRGDD